MNKQLSLSEFQPGDAAQIDAVTALWNSAAPPDLPLSSRFVRYNSRPVSGGAQAGQVAQIAGETVGVVSVSTIQGQPLLNPQQTGWIDLLVVHPAHQRRGIGTGLISWAEQWLMDRNCRRVQVGAGLYPFAPGLPSTLESDDFFHRLGYDTTQCVWDLSANLATYEPPATVREVPGVVRPAQPTDAEALGAFLAREFPGRWSFAFEEACRTADYRLSDYMVLWTERGIDGFCRLSFEDSQQPIERYYPYTLPRPWGQLGPIGVSADRRGQGFGAALVDAGLRRLHNNGVNGCVIDWTTIVDFYGKFGFAPYREYRQLSKMLMS